MLIAKNIIKKFPGVTALSNVNLSLSPGKVTAIIGENGAGKSTLMKILSGIYTDYEGEIILNNKILRLKNVKEATEAGIAIIHQELNLVPHLSIAENIFLGNEIVNNAGLLENTKMNRVCLDLLSALHLKLNPETKIIDLKIGQQQLVEIAKAIHTQASLLIMDEPTSALSDAEVNILFTIIRQLKNKGKTILYISHKLDELFAIADEYIVLRDGAQIESGQMQSVSKSHLILKMSGREIKNDYAPHNYQDKQEILSVSNLFFIHPKYSQTSLHNISFSANKGEILGIYGLMGAGRSELLECLFGLNPQYMTGQIKINSEVCQITSPDKAIEHGLALVPEDRKSQGLAVDHSIKSNICLTILKRLSNWLGFIENKKENDFIQKAINQLNIKTSTVDNIARTLSGGNQQKIVLAKWLATDPQILMLDEPTRGIDIKTKSEIYALIRSLAESGKTILLVSSEIPEILAVSDRIMIMHEGHVTAFIDRPDASETILLKHALANN